MKRRKKKKKKEESKRSEPAFKKERITLGEKSFAEACLPFERPIAELEKTIRDLKMHSREGIDLSEEIKSTEKKLERAIEDIFSNLTPWQRVQVARHPLRPYNRGGLSLRGYQTVPVLCYHKFSKVVSDKMTVREEDFKKQMQFIQLNELQLKKYDDHYNPIFHFGDGVHH